MSRPAGSFPHTDPSPSSAHQRAPLGYQANLMTAQDVADFLQMSKTTIDTWRSTGGGPRFIKVARGLVRYRPQALLEWIEGREVQNTTQADKLDGIRP